MVSLYLTIRISHIKQTLISLLASFAAFCRNYGDYYTPAVGGHCWNSEATKVMVTYMNTQWQTFCQDIQAHQDKSFGSIEDTFNRAIALCA